VAEIARTGRRAADGQLAVLTAEVAMAEAEIASAACRQTPAVVAARTTTV